MRLPATSKENSGIRTTMSLCSGGMGHFVWRWTEKRRCRRPTLSGLRKCQLPSFTCCSTGWYIGSAWPKHCLWPSTASKRGHLCFPLNEKRTGQNCGMVLMRIGAPVGRTERELTYCLSMAFWQRRRLSRHEKELIIRNAKEEAAGFLSTPYDDVGNEPFALAPSLWDG